MTLKENDIIDVSMSIKPQIPKEDEEKTVIDLNDYATDYSISYSYPDSGFTDVSFTEDAGCSSFVDIEEYLKDSLQQDIEEIDEYELFDIDNAGEYQTAKIKILKIKEEKRED